MCVKLRGTTPQTPVLRTLSLTNLPLFEIKRRIYKSIYKTFRYYTFQISFAYSMMVLSLENAPAFTTFARHFLANAFLSE